MGFALGDGGQKGGLDVGGLVDAGRYSVGDQFEQEVFLALRRVLSSSTRSAVCRGSNGSAGMPWQRVRRLVGDSFSSTEKPPWLCSGARGYGRPAQVGFQHGAAGTRSPMARQAHFGMKRARPIVALKRGFWECCLAVRSPLGGGLFLSAMVSARNSAPLLRLTSTGTGRPVGSCPTSSANWVRINHFGVVDAGDDVAGLDAGAGGQAFPTSLTSTPDSPCWR